MLKIEKRLLLWIEKHMFLLMTLLTAVLALYLRRTAVWWTSPEAGYYFDRHENNIQSAFYHLAVYLTQYMPFLPLHTVKWFAGITDFVTAVLLVAAVGGHREERKLKQTFLFTVCILSPVVYLRGICWGQIDSAAFALLLGGYLLWRKGRRFPAVFLAALGVALYPCYCLIVLVWMLSQRQTAGYKDWICLGGVFAGSCLLQGIAGVMLGENWTEGVLSCIRWISYDPYLGVMYTEPMEWGKQMVNLFGYGVAMTGLGAACRHRISCTVALLVHLAVLIVYGSILFPIAV